MEVEKKGEQIVATLTREDVFGLQAGKTIFGENRVHGDRPAVTMSDANFEVAPLSAIEQDDSLKDRWSMDRLEKAMKAELKGHLSSDGDLRIFVPAIKLSDVRLGGAKLPRESIKTSGTENGRALIEHVIPPNGIILNFGGTLKTVNIPSFFT